MDILRLIDELDETIHNAPSVPLTNQVRIDRDKLYDLLDQIRASLPEEIAQARRIVEERRASEGG